jgi:hypothetical protein
MKYTQPELLVALAAAKSITGSSGEQKNSSPCTDSAVGSSQSSMGAYEVDE